VNNLKLILFVFVTVMLFGCGGGGSSSTTEPEQVTNDIQGVWQFVYDDSLCVETTTFNNDDSFTITSSDTVISGVYDFTSTVDEGARHSLVMTIQTDNGETDCGGVSDISTELPPVYAEFPSSTVLRLYQALTGDNLIQEFTKASSE